VSEGEDRAAEFLRAACVAPGTPHVSGTVARAEEILAAHPEVATASIHAAAVLGDDEAVRGFLARDPASATARGGPHGWDALTHLCFSRFLRAAPERSAGFVAAARALLDAGASANAGWHEAEEPPVWESVLYGAAGIAHHPELTRLLLERGADPNDGEVPYHAPESRDNRALRVLVESGRLTADSLAMMLLRKHDWHDEDGARLLLEHGADPNRFVLGRPSVLHAVLRDNAREMVALLLDHGADPTLTANRVSAVALAARRGRGDLLALFAQRGVPVDLDGVDALTAACARGDGAGARAVAAREPDALRMAMAHGGTLLAQFAGNGNAEGVGLLLELGMDVAARYREGDGYFGVARDSTALHVAAWRARHATVRLLLERGAPVDAVDGAGSTPLALAVRACVDSYWTHLRSPDSVRALLAAGASPAAAPYPSGYDEVDALLRDAGRTA
jgi:ankyrin repeat protein